MHDDLKIVEGRLDRALRELIRPAIRPLSAPLELGMWAAGDHGQPGAVAVAEAMTAAYVPAAVGDPWGAPWTTTWFHLQGRVPEAWAGQRVEVVLDLGARPSQPGFQAEGLVYDRHGVPLKGVHPRNRYVAVAESARGGEEVELWAEASANPDILAGGFAPTPLGDPVTAGSEPLYRVQRAELTVLDTEVWHLWLDTLVLRELMAELDSQGPRRHEVLRALDHMVDALDPDDVAGTASAARAELASVLGRRAHASAHRVSAVGHAHIDSAWLWPVAETMRKCARTFANVTALADDYPELVFACSQAQQYAWVKEHQPAVYERLVEAVKAGQVVPVGGMWVEPDGNLPGGEALARQLVHGQRFFADELGLECRELWMPDSFGYTAALPQLARLAGMQWFLSQKLSWNQTNRFPHHTFWWEGIDGSRLFAHFPPVDTYGCELTGRELAHTVANFAEKGLATRSLVPFGYGDGGGGPTREMLERARRLADLEGSPRVAIESPPSFFAAAQDEYPDAPVWSGELYLELHRATFTSQARIKAGNRRCEHLLREAELWATTAAVYHGWPYPYDDLDRLWKDVLLHQFHDILPGSSIAWVHWETEVTHTRVAAELEAIITSALSSLTGPLHDGPTRWACNASPFARREPVAGTVVSVPPLGMAPVADAADDGAEGAGVQPVVVTGRTLDNGLVRVELDDDGLLRSVRDLAADREVLAPGARGNLLVLHTDRPNQWDAWDVDTHYRRRSVDLTGADPITVADDGSLVGAIGVERRFGSSSISQVIRLRAGSRRVDIETEIDWHERQKFLKAAFPLDVHADRLSAEIQFGHVQRPTHTNTSWEAARFENYAHRWVHVGEAGYGVALLTDSTYGHDVDRTTRPDGGTTTTVRLSLVRAPLSPDPGGDAGSHRFTYSLLVGASIGDAIAGGYGLNLPLRVVSGPPVEAGLPALAPVVAIDNPAVVVEAVKLADDQSGEVVVRLYESLGGRARARLRTGFDLADAEVVDLLERSGTDDLPGRDALVGIITNANSDSDKRSVELALRPFQIVTLRLTPAAKATPPSGSA